MGATPVFKDEFECEEALVKLAGCCGPDSPPPPVSCYRGRGCEDSTPGIGEERSLAIRHMSCDEILVAGYCNDPRSPMGDLK